MEKRSYNPQKIKLDLKHVPPLDPSIITPSSKVKYEKHRPNSGVFAPRVVKAWPEAGAKVAEFDDASKLRQNLKVGGASFDDASKLLFDDASKLRQNLTMPQNYGKSCYLGLCSTKYIDPNSTKNNIHGKNIESSTGNEKRLSESKSEDAPVKVSAKSQLHEVCAAKNWKPPLFECFKEEGPDHLKLFTYKVTFVIESSKTFLESFSAPQPTKKTAAEHAAEGALWYLNHLGYFPIQK